MRLLLRKTHSPGPFPAASLQDAARSHRKGGENVYCSDFAPPRRGKITAFFLFPAVAIAQNPVRKHPVRVMWGFPTLAIAQHPVRIGREGKKGIIVVF